MTLGLTFTISQLQGHVLAIRDWKEDKAEGKGSLIQPGLMADAPCLPAVLSLQRQRGDVSPVQISSIRGMRGMRGALNAVKRPTARRGLCEKSSCSPPCDLTMYIRASLHLLPLTNIQCSEKCLEPERGVKEIALKVCQDHLGIDYISRTLETKY